MGGRNGLEGEREGCDGNYEVGAYVMEWVHNWEPEQSRVTNWSAYKTTLSNTSLLHTLC